MKSFLFFVLFSCLLIQTFCFDFIIIGGGASGCALAATLAPKGSVLLIERGKPISSEPLSQNVSGWPGILGDISSNNDAAEDIRTTEGVWNFAPRILGGGTSVNVGVWIRENQDYFSGLGLTLDYSRVVSSYQWAESRLVSPNLNSSVALNLRAAFATSSMTSTDYNLNRVPNATHLTFSTFQSTGSRNRRGAAALLPTNFPNLVVLTQNRVNRILFDTNSNPPKAIGVEVQDLTNIFGSFKVFLNQNANSRIFLSSGAIYSPFLLLRSGVAPSSLNLGNYGISRIATNEGVGRNFVDKPVVPIHLLIKNPISQSMVEVVGNSGRYVVAQTGGGSIISTLAPVSGSLIAPAFRTQIVRLALKLVFDALPASTRATLNNGVQIITFLSEPLSRGQVTLDLLGLNPQVTGGYYSDPAGNDLAQHVANIQRTIQLLNSPGIVQLVQDPNVAVNTFNSLNGAVANNSDLSGTPPTNMSTNNIPTLPTLPADPNNPDQVSDWILKNYGPSYHNAGSLSQAVDSNFTLQGVQGIVVTDASVLRQTPRTHPQATLVMLGNYIGNTVPSASNTINCGEGTWSSTTRRCTCKNVFWSRPLNCAGNGSFCPCSCYLGFCL